MQTIWPEEERKKKKTQWEAFSFYYLRSLDGSGDKNSQEQQCEGVEGPPIQVFKCREHELILLFVTFAPLPLWGLGITHSTQGWFPSFHTSWGEQSTKNSAVSSYPSDGLDPFCSSVVFCGHKAKIIVFIWCWVIDLIRKSWLKRLADFFLFSLAVS